MHTFSFLTLPQPPYSVQSVDIDSFSHKKRKLVVAGDKGLMLSF